MSSTLITEELFAKMSYDTEYINLQRATNETDTYNGVSNPSVLIIFANSDINAAIYHLRKSLYSPFEPQAVATVLVQESIKEDFLEKVQQVEPKSSNKLKSSEKVNKALDTAKKLNATVITLDGFEKNFYKPTIVCDLTHNQLSASAPSGVVTLHTFRTAKEAIALVNKESVKFANVSIWHTNHGHAYELVTALKSNYFFINCYQVSFKILEESIKQGKNFVSLDKSYHYETLQHNGIQKSIVFPIGSIFAN